MTDTIHGSIVKAICKVQLHIDAVKKSQRNAHGGYMFASTDDIYAEIMRRMADAGLVVMSLEEEAEIQRLERDGKVVQWAKMVFGFILATEEATWEDRRSKRTRGRSASPRATRKKIRLHSTARPSASRPTAPRRMA